jgi:DNA gyrase subunit A
MGVKEVTDELEELAGRSRITSRSSPPATGSCDHLRRTGRGAREIRRPRRTEIVDWSGDMEDEDLIEREDMVVTITQGGYIKRTPLVDFRAQKRGGKGCRAAALKEDDVVTSLFVANTHTPLLFFTTDRHGLQAQDLAPALGLPRLARQGHREHPADRTGHRHRRRHARRPGRGSLGRVADRLRHLGGRCARNALSDFTNVMRNGKIAMKLPEDDSVSLVNARICSEDDDVMLVTAGGRAIRFPTTDVRVFKGRDSTGVRGIRLADGDHVVSMAVIRHFEANPEERAAYLKQRRLMAGVTEEAETDEEEAAPGDLSQERYAEMSAAEDLILTITRGGSGKLSSSHDYPVRGRGGQGVIAMDKAMRGGALVACFPVEMEDQIMLATSTGQSIRVPVDGISFRSRSAGGVKVFNTAQVARKSSRSPGSPIKGEEDEAETPEGRDRRHLSEGRPPKCGGAAINSFRIFRKPSPFATGCIASLAASQPFGVACFDFDFRFTSILSHAVGRDFWSENEGSIWLERLLARLISVTPRKCRCGC